MILRFAYIFIESILGNSGWTNNIVSTRVQDEIIGKFSTMRLNLFEKRTFSILVIQFEKCIFWKLARIKWKWHFEICIWNVCKKLVHTHTHTQARARGKNKISQFRFASRLVIPPFLAHFSILGDAATYTRHLLLFHSRSRSECAWREEERWDRHQRYDSRLLLKRVIDISIPERPKIIALVTDTRNFIDSSV